MRSYLVLMATLALVLGLAGAMCAQEPGWNELDNGCFIDGSSAWEASPAVQFNAGGGDVFGRPHIAVDPWPIPGAAGSIRQIVDNTRSPYWNASLNHKIVDVWFDVYTTGTAYVVIGFDWWDYMGATKPVGAAPYEELLSTQFTSVNEWTRFHVTYDFLGKPGLTDQPRWVSLEFGFFGCSGTGYEAAVDDVIFQSKCVPEPSSLALALSSLVGMAGMAWRRRK